MRIFIELPTWLGDAVMATPAIENIAKTNPDAKFILFGSAASVELFKNHPNVEQIIVDKTKNLPILRRFIQLKEITKNCNKIYGKFDLAFSFRSSFVSKITLFLLHADNKFQYKKGCFGEHMVEKYAYFVKESLKIGTDFEIGDLKLYEQSHKFCKYEKPKLGINPGAAYGSAKRWYPQEFAKVAARFAFAYDIVIFGGASEVDIAQEIEDILEKDEIKVQNLAGKTTIGELLGHIGGLSFFITNDSGPMHIAAAYKIPTVAIFGPTDHRQTCQWNNPNSKIIRHDLPCSPCKKRVCPLKHHNCMKFIEADEVNGAIEAMRNAMRDNA